MKKIFGIALCFALFAGGAHAQQVNQLNMAAEPAVLTETELTDVVLFTNGRAEKGIVLEVTAGQPVRIIQADGIVHAYSPLLVDRIVRGCGVEILHMAAPAGNKAAMDEPVESYDDKPDYYEEPEAARTARRAPLRRPKVGTVHAAAAAARPGARRPLRGVQPVAPRRAHVQPAGRPRAVRRAAAVEARPRAVRAAKAGTARVRTARGAKRR